jgi:transcriptional regulator with XRE-family HTH domain
VLRYSYTYIKEKEVVTHTQALQLHLRTLRITQEISYQALADLTGVSRQAIYQTLNSESVTLDKLISLADSWGYDVDINVRKREVFIEK